ncbi:alpha/beta fold hydrolase [Pseudonocardia sp. CA-107938]|uniref:alpha/beta fold hydrolase n=1 Tax=Pseudonocardia sp. CA-107938 TaxID=3240021 RepID=UPI003D8E614A
MDHTVVVPGARLRVRTSGSGPVLLLLGGAADGGGLGELRTLLEDSFTVVTYDRRGLGGSPADDPEAAVEVGTDADDAAAVLAAVAAGPALVAGTSNGAVQGLELAIRHPQRVRLLVAHEPPLPALLPAAVGDAVAAAQRGIDDRIRAGRITEAVDLLGDLTGTGDPARRRPPPAGLDAARAAFLARVALPLHRYRPDRAALAACPVGIVPAAGEVGAELVGPRSAAELARIRGTSVVTFPGGHAGFVEHPSAFAARLRDVLVQAVA